MKFLFYPTVISKSQRLESESWQDLFRSPAHTGREWKEGKAPGGWQGTKGTGGC